MTELSHYGVKGMKWGVRKTAHEVARQTLLSTSDKRKANAERHAAGVSFTAKTGKKIFGELRAQRVFDKSLARVQKERASLEAGKIRVRDIDRNLMNVGVSNIAIGAYRARKQYLQEANAASGR